MKGLSVLLVVWLGLLAAAEAEPAVRYILVSISLIVGIVAAFVGLGVYVIGDRR